MREISKEMKKCKVDLITVQKAKWKEIEINIKHSIVYSKGKESVNFLEYTIRWCHFIFDGRLKFEYLPC